MRKKILQLKPTFCIQKSGSRVETAFPVVLYNCNYFTSYSPHLGRPHFAEVPVVVARHGKRQSRYILPYIIVYLHIFTRIYIDKQFFTCHDRTQSIGPFIGQAYLHNLRSEIPFSHWVSPEKCKSSISSFLFSPVLTSLCASFLARF